MTHKIRYFVLMGALLTMIFSNVICAGDSEPSELPRICALIPDTWVEFPAIAPAIPADYIMMRYDNLMSIAWGAKEDLDGYKMEEAQNPPNRAIFLLNHSTEQQTGPNSFSFTKKSFIQEMQKAGVKVTRARNARWGEYPLFIYEGNGPRGQCLRSIWVGLNSPDGWVLHISMIPTKNRMEDEKLWNRFVEDTKTLSGAEYFQAYGSDMKDGMTTHWCAKAAVKAQAERRSKDKKLAIKVIPLNEYTTFQVHKSLQTIMSGGWRNGDPVTKIYGTMTYKSDQYNNQINAVVNVFTKEVSEFSFEPDDEQI